MNSNNSKKAKSFVFDDTHFEINYEHGETEQDTEAQYADKIIAGDLDFFAKDERRKKREENKKSVQDKNVKNEHDGHRQRMYKRLLETGLNGFPEHEVLEMVLYTAFARGDTKPLARTLLKEFSSLKNVLDADPRDLMTVKGISYTTAAKLMLFKEVMEYIKLNDKELTLSTADEVGEYCIKHFGDKDIECLYLLSFDKKDNLKSVNLISTGDETQTDANANEIIRCANMLKSDKVILCHNHPDGNVNPSSNDINLTNKLREILDILNIELADHIICSRTRHTSLAQRNMIAYTIKKDL